MRGVRLRRGAPTSARGYAPRASDRGTTAGWTSHEHATTPVAVPEQRVHEVPGTASRRPRQNDRRTRPCIGLRKHDDVERRAEPAVLASSPSASPRRRHRDLPGARRPAAATTGARADRKGQEERAPSAVTMISWGRRARYADHRSRRSPRRSWRGTSEHHRQSTPPSRRAVPAVCVGPREWCRERGREGDDNRGDGCDLPTRSSGVATAEPPLTERRRRTHEGHDERDPEGCTSPSSAGQIQKSKTEFS